MTAIQIANLSKTFGKSPKGRDGTHRALDDISLSIGRGEMVALIGASGSGKSTLIRHVSGLLVADRAKIGRSSKVSINGCVVQSNGRLNGNVRRLRVEVAVIFQQFNLVGRLSLLENVLLGGLGRIGFWRGSLGRFNRTEKLAAMEALSRVGMEAYAMQRASTLSGGQQQRGAIARALVQKASIILADEPIASLDPESARRVMDSLATINREDGTTVVVSLHQVAYAKKYCPRSVALAHGKVLHDGPSAALDLETLCTLYGAQCEDLVMDETLGAVTVPCIPAAVAVPPPLRAVGCNGD
ncbi:MAG: phosphonate ABC transporter ATP-binding protein [Rhodospirillaceae bacterium]|nr:phosphonate ABC transporter ATP-binding protein [Rhodospirillaceae bacterium]